MTFWDEVRLTVEKHYIADSCGDTLRGEGRCVITARVVRSSHLNENVLRRHKGREHLDKNVNGKGDVSLRPAF